MNKVIRTLILIPVALTFGATTLYAQTSTTPSTLNTYSTVRSIGIEWVIVGDSNHNASVAVAYRVQGAATWSDALPLVRVDNANANMLAGSILFLAPGTTYDVSLPCRKSRRSIRCSGEPQNAFLGLGTINLMDKASD